MIQNKLCLVDSRITNHNIFMDNVNSETVSVLIDYENDDFISLLTKIENKIQLSSIYSIAYVAHGTFEPTYSFFNKVDAFDMYTDINTSWELFFKFLREINNLTFFDFLGCNLASNDAWKKVFSSIENALQHVDGINRVNVRASTDMTGNLGSGGNWILEEGSVDDVSVDAKALYFTDLDNFNELLGSGGGKCTFVVVGNEIYSVGGGAYLPTVSPYNTDWAMLGRDTNTNTLGSVTYEFFGKMTDTEYSGKTPKQIVHSFYFTVVLMTDGSIYTCGRDNLGRIRTTGVNANVGILTEISIPAGYTPISIACGDSHTVVLMTHATFVNKLYAFGNSTSGSLGFTAVNSTILVAMNTTYTPSSTRYPVKIACGKSHTVVLMADNTLWACGINTSMQCGTGTVGDQMPSTPNFTQMTNTNLYISKTISEIACGSLHTVVLTTDGTLWVCGTNNNGGIITGQLGIAITSSAPPTSSFALVPMTNLTTLVTYGNRTPIAIDGGNLYTVVLMNDGTIWQSGKLSSNTNPASNTYVRLTQIFPPSRLVLGYDDSIGNNNTIAFNGTNTITFGQASGGGLPTLTEAGWAVDDTITINVNQTTRYRFLITVLTNPTTNRSTLTVTNTDSAPSIAAGAYGFSRTPVNTPTPVQIVCGSDHFTVLMSDKSVYACGVPLGAYNSLGTGTASALTLTKITNTLIDNTTDKFLNKSLSLSATPCFNENTKILCLKGNNEEYVPVQHLKKGDLVKTYSNSPVYKKIVLIGKGKLVNNPDIWSKCMYKMEKTDNNGLTEDLIITGGHSILVDELSETDKEKEELLNRTDMVDDKLLVWAGLSEKFSNITDNNVYTYYHFVLEDEETEDNTLYGVWANGVLVETIKRKDFFSYGLK